MLPLHNQTALHNQQAICLTLGAFPPLHFHVVYEFADVAQFRHFYNRRSNFVPPISSAKQRITYPYSVKSFLTSYDYLADFTELANQLTICSRRVKAEPTVTQSAPISIATFCQFWRVITPSAITKQPAAFKSFTN